MQETILTFQDFYTQTAEYLSRLDSSGYETGFREALHAEMRTLHALLGDGRGRKVLDCGCGEGRQTIALALLGWQVTALDVTDASLHTAAEHAKEQGVNVDFQRGDMRHLSSLFPQEFDGVVCCAALDNLLEDRQIKQTLSGIVTVLKPEGICFIRQRDFDHLLSLKPRFNVMGKRLLPHGQIIRIEEWDFDSDLIFVQKWRG